jgi:hypothetical protein
MATDETATDTNDVTMETTEAAQPMDPVAMMKAW